MSDTNEPKKISLADAIKQKLAQKKDETKKAMQKPGDTNVKKMKSQNTKRPDNHRRKTGG